MTCLPLPRGLRCAISVLRVAKRVVESFEGGWLCAWSADRGVRGLRPTGIRGAVKRRVRGIALFEDDSVAEFRYAESSWLIDGLTGGIAPDLVLRAKKVQVQALDSWMVLCFRIRAGGSALQSCRKESLVVRIVARKS